METRKLVFSTSSFKALAMISGGGMTATKIAKDVVKPQTRRLGGDGLLRRRLNWVSHLTGFLYIFLSSAEDKTEI